MSAASRILVTRPGEGGERLAQALSEAGFVPVHPGLMHLQPLAVDEVARGAVLDFDLYDVVIVTSPFAAECLVDWLDRYWPQLPQGPRFYALGVATAAMLHQGLGIKANVPDPHRGTTSETLLAMRSLARLDGQRVLVVGGVGGRQTLAQTLEARGARATKLALYRRVYTAPDETAAGWLANGDFTAMTVTSGELLEHLVIWCGQAALNKPLIVSSQRLATLADTMGFASLHVAQGATPEALVTAVQEVGDT
ncbi:uroporphyrinogen-III synthase [Chromohalobacter marismortui]|uniref:Uroporphyrinogen-III synthase n=1 Tax=Chromohalobacter marismortui TaxID=42055 RepID=A0A4R7NFE0_9GAMM|nr:MULTISPECIES: uroporphyrinogen-III synthase [Chromohalobacter]MCI0510043.1 uroporphyrinogen-III synthase [Chromohalobacter sp.]MCI0593798.1 uroporphyrinogen-III synthase [Chromohalobacter sp.]TDU18988.1 uroporphyrinogen-III synthase [Chromohalobacter marismortui]